MFLTQEERKERLTIHSSALSDAVLTPDGKKLYYLTKFEKDYDLWMQDLLKKETKQVLKLGSRGGAIFMDKKGKNLFVFSDGKAYKVGVDDHKKDKPTLLTLYDPEKDELWEEIIKPISRGEESGLLYERWVKTMRELTDSLSGGKVGYVHVRSMGSESNYSDAQG